MSRSITPTSSDRSALRAEDQDFCVAILPHVSRTFALSIEALPASLRGSVRAAYLLCRVVDTIEDAHGIDGRARKALFDAFDALVGDDTSAPEPFEALCRAAAIGDGRADGELCRHAGRLARVFRALPDSVRAIVRPRVLEMSSGMRETCARADAARGGLRIDDMEGLERYCYFVAGTVGQLLTALFERDVPDLGAEARRGLRDRAVSFGLGLQMVNIVKDAAQDFEEGSCFLPRSLAQEHGLALDRLLDPDARPAGLAVVRAVCDRARDHLSRAREYVLLWPAGLGGDGPGAAVRLFCAVPLALALLTLAEVEGGAGTLRRGETPKVSRALVAGVLAEARAAATDDVELSRLLDRCASAPAGLPSGSFL